MDRKHFLRVLAGLPLATMDLRSLAQLTGPFGRTERMPVLFLGHGSPMNAIEENEFVAGFRRMGQEVPRPNAILCVSAHWETIGTQVTAMERPPTIHDFGGFPKALYDVEYPAPGSPELAQETQRIVTTTSVGLDRSWGLDHGAWSVVKHMYPQANVPIIQLSLDRRLSPTQHYALAQELAQLRDRGVLIIGSGNMVHNLGLIAWDRLNDPNAYGYDWALEAQARMRDLIVKRDHQALIDFRAQGHAFDLAIPTPEHYLPMLYSLALQQPGEQVTLFNDKPLGGSLTMTSLKIDKA